MVEGSKTLWMRSKMAWEENYPKTQGWAKEALTSQLQAKSGRAKIHPNSFGVVLHTIFRGIRGLTM